MSRLACTVGAILISGILTGCSDDLVAAGPDLGEDTALRLGRVHVLVDRTDAPTTDPERLDSFQSLVEVTARFAYVRGFDEEFTRAQADIPVVASDVIRPGQCVPTDLLLVDHAPSEPEPTDGREFVLLDAGEIAVDLAGNRIDIPVSLIPDLLPYMSGVEYVFLSDATVDPVIELTSFEAEVHVTAEGTQSDELADFSIKGQLPTPPVLSLDGSIEDNTLRLSWEGKAQSNPVIVRVATLAAGESTGTEVTCVFEDTGAGHIDVGILRLQGLDPSSADALALSASRLSRTTFDAGEFAAAELVVEVRDSITVGR